MREEGDMRRAGALSIQAGTGAGCLCAGTHWALMKALMYTENSILRKIHLASGLRDRRSHWCFFSFVAHKTVMDTKRLLLLLVLDFTPA